MNRFHPGFFCRFLIILTGLLALSDPSSASATTPAKFNKPVWLDCDVNKPIEMRILHEYGAVYLSTAFENRPSSNKMPCRFDGANAVFDFAEAFKREEGKLWFGEFFLQPEAKAKLVEVFDLAGGYKNVVRNCTGNDCSSDGFNNDWAFRTYEQTKTNWNEKLIELRLTQHDENDIALHHPAFLYSRAVPGGSQHHLGLAIDVNDGRNSSGKICKETGCVDKLNSKGWYRTVRYDAYHFTYLGHPETSLRAKGLKRVKCGDFFYWVPRVDGYREPTGKACT